MTSGIVDALSALKTRKQVPARPGSQVPERLSSEAPRRTQLPGVAKSKHPDFEAAKIFLRSETKRRAWRKYEDAGGREFSDLVEMLLAKYLSS